jgi:hypothetical protein
VSSGNTQPPGLSLERMQSALGYTLFSDAVTAKQVRSSGALTIADASQVAAPRWAG